MTSLAEHLLTYARAHRDRRNIATHCVGIPMIVLGLLVGLNLVSVPLAGIPLSAAVVLAIAACAYWARLDVPLGIAMAVVMFLLYAVASEATARLGVGGALGLAAALFVVGWALQLWGHWFEGVKPAFVDDLRQLMIGPLFVAAEVAFLLGMRQELRASIEAAAGPTVARRGH
jgi:uncharacterized membrane protein YGL010W